MNFLKNDGSVGGMAMHGLFWSVVQNWGGRVVTFGLFVVLARLLDPTQFGIASAAAIIFLIITLVAEFGFTDAIIQRAGLEDADVNLPFYFSVSVSVILASIVVGFSGWLEVWLKVAGTRWVIVALAMLTPITTISMFQEMQYKRHLAFRQLAGRVLVANCISAVVSISMAVAGYGVWALVAQQYTATIIGLIWMWARPYWKPGLELRPKAFVSLVRFGFSILAVRLMDFGSTRLVELITIGRYGVSAYGLYAAGSRLSQTMLDMLQAALSDVSLSVLSKISNERERMAAIYRVSTIIASNLLSPIFILCASVSSEITDFIFGPKWAGISGIVRILLLLGAVFVIQFLSRPYLSARGRSEQVLVIATFKSVVTIVGLIFLPHHTIYQLVLVFAAMQLLASPVAFYITSRELGAPVSRLVRDVLPVVISGTIADRAVWLARPWVEAQGLTASLPKGIVLGGLFVTLYVAVVVALSLVIGRSQILVVREFVLKRLKGSKA